MKAMLYGFGDVHDPYEETVETVEDAVHDYVANTVGEGEREIYVTLFRYVKSFRFLNHPPFPSLSNS